MHDLNLPKYDLKIRKENELYFIFDPLRKKYVKLTPEEWVRQNFVSYLINDLGYPKGLINVEANLLINGLNKRADIVLYSNKAFPLMIVECKAPNIKIDQKVFDQIAVYNMKLNVKVLIVTNGISHYACLIDTIKNKYHFLEEIPDYNQILNL